jgi:hypothetical protein
MSRQSVAESTRTTMSGFTPVDLATLAEIRTAALVQRRWVRAEIIQDQFIDYLAAWDGEADAAAAPSLAIARFKRTGTYALTISSIVVATAPSLGKILPALQAQLQTTDRQLIAVA